MAMRIQISPTSEKPVYQQIVEQVEMAVAGGKLLPGDRLPSIRELAAQLRINPNTVARAYRELERAGVIETRGANGSFVARANPRWVERTRRRYVSQRLSEAIDAANAVGLSADELRQLFEDLVRKKLRRR